MIAARQIAFGKAAGKRKPYDAEVEFLQSSGTGNTLAWVDTGIPNTANIRVEATARCVATPIPNTIDLYVFGSGWGAGVDIAYGIVYSDRWTDLGKCMLLTRGGTGGSFSPDMGTSITGDGQFHSFVYETNDSMSSITVDNGAPFVITTPRKLNGTTYGIFGPRDEATSSGIAQIAQLKIYDANSVLVRDFIPVRVGDVGYMYDRVSGQLFGNAGTGEFVLGPDVNRNEDAFILVSPTQTAIHYSPIVTTDTFSLDEDFRIELRYKCLQNGLGSWGTILGTTGGTNKNGINLRQRNTTNEAYFLIGGTNSNYFDCSNWVDLSFSPSEGPVVNGTIVLSPALIDMSKFTSTSPLYIGEGPRGYGATCASAWKYVRIYRNGVMTRNYIPHVSGSFIDTVSGNILEVDSRSTTMVEYYES